MAEYFLEPQNPLKKIDETTGDVTYVYPLTTDKQVMMENGERLNTVLKENILYMGETGEESIAEVINADSVGGYTVPVLMESFIDKIYPVGSTYVTSTNESPASYLGGTWSLVGKGFRDYAKSDADCFTMNTTNCSAYSLALVRSGNTLRIRLNFTNVVAFTDTNVEIGNFNLEGLGINFFTKAFNYILCASDGGNFMAMATIDYDTGLLKINDVIDVDSTATGVVSYINVVEVCTADSMLDSACDKFYWKRTA